MKSMAWLFILSVAVALYGQATNVGPVGVTVNQAASAADQIARAASLVKQMEQTPPPEKFQLFAQAWANLSLVRKSWPNDRLACIRSGIMQSDLAAELGLWRKEVDVLNEILPLVRHTPDEPQVEEKLGRAYELAGNPSEAEHHLLAAQQAMLSEHADLIESQKILDSLGHLYKRQGRPADAIKQFRDAQNLPGQTIMNKVGFQVSIIAQTERMGGDASVELSRFDDLVYAARGTSLSAADATLLQHMIEQVQRSRKGH